MRRVRMVGRGCDCDRASLAAARHSFAEELRLGADVALASGGGSVREGASGAVRRRGAWRRWLRKNGCGTGYFSVILAETVGAGGAVTEMDAALAGRAAVAVAAWPPAAVIAADGSSYCGGQFDLIVASAGVTHPPPVWLDLM